MGIGEFHGALADHAMLEAPGAFDLEFSAVAEGGGGLGKTGFESGERFVVAVVERDVGGNPWRSGTNSRRWSAVTSKASERRARRSQVALTGAKRLRGTKIAPEAAKHSRAAPMALSS